MSEMNHHEMEYIEERLQSSRSELTTQIASHQKEDGEIQVLDGVYLARLSRPLNRMHSVLKPSFCVIAQGSKVVFMGDRRYQYDPYHYCLTTIELPRITQVADASRENPYLSLRLELDPNLVSSVLVESGHVIVANNADTSAIDVSLLDVDLLDAVLRLTRLINTPMEARILMPLIKREIIYRLLSGEQGASLYHLIVAGSYTSNIAKAVKFLRENFDQPIRIEDLAQDLGMSMSSFHQHFKSVTSMSPLQFQKQVRLQEARRLMLGEDLDATSAALRVGYNDTSHFSREYKSLFGAPPMRDVQRLREVANASSS